MSFEQSSMRIEAFLANVYINHGRLHMANCIYKYTTSSSVHWTVYINNGQREIRCVCSNADIFSPVCSTMQTYCQIIRTYLYLYRFVVTYLVNRNKTIPVTFSVQQLFSHSHLFFILQIYIYIYFIQLCIDFSPTKENEKKCVCVRFITGHLFEIHLPYQPFIQCIIYLI